MTDYNNIKPNSHKYKAEQQVLAERKKVDKVITGSARVKKKSGLAKMADVFMPEDISSIKSYFWTDIVVPAVIDTLYEIGTKGLGAVFGRSDRGRKSSSSYTSYRKYYDDARDHRDRDRTGTRYNLDDIVLNSRADAEAVLRQMDDIIDVYGTVSVGDLFDLVDISHNYTDNKYGWKSIRNAEVIRVRDGYALRLPKAMPID